MMRKKIIISVALVSALSSSLFGITLEEGVSEVLNNNPIVQERLKNYRATQQDLNIAQSEFYPKVDLIASGGFNDYGNLNDDIEEGDYTNYETSLTVTQNLFDGFGTINKIDYQNARITAAAYNYVEKANDVAFKYTSAYINVLRAHELLKIAKENIEINEGIYTKVKDLFEAGLTTDSEVKKIQSSLSLARSNYTVQKNNTIDTEFSYKRVLGRMPDVASMQLPSLDLAMPESLERATMFAIKNNPSLIVSDYNIKGVQELRAQRNKEFYPKLDLEVSQLFNDSNPDDNGFDQPDDRFRAKLILSYNLYKGGADRANMQKHISMVNQEIEIKRDLKRQVIEGLELSWSAHEMIGKQLKDLREYSKYSEKTLDLYKEEYDLGRRTLLDLLSSQSDVINSRTQIVSAEYEALFAKYRILDAMGVLPLAILGTNDQINSKVNLINDQDIHEILDTEPVKLDVDNDNIVDGLDICDNSLNANNIMPYGCSKPSSDSFISESDSKK